MLQKALERFVNDLYGENDIYWMSKKTSKKPKPFRKARLKLEKLISMIASIVTILMAIFEIFRYYFERK